jgi:hypothetical protein
MVAYRRLHIFQIHWPPKVLDHTNAVNCRDSYALHLIERAETSRRCKLPPIFSLETRLTITQPANNVTELTVVFTSLVMFSATQGKR